jgi:hypothetical protein
MPDSISRLLDLVTQSASTWTTGGVLLRAALVCCSVFALVQLLSMWATHYGDRNVSSKSFFLSLLLHCCFALGWAAVIESSPRPSEPPGETNAPRVKVTLKNDDEPSTEPGTNSLPLWNQSQDRPDPALTRSERPEVEPAPVEQPVAETTSNEPPTAPQIPDLPTRAVEPVEIPQPLMAADSKAASPAKPSVDIDQPLREARPETTVAANTARQHVQRESSAIDTATRIEPQRGSAERMAPLIEDGVVLTLPTELAPEATSPKPVGAPGEDIRRRSSPSPTPTDLAEAGVEPKSRAKSTTGDRRTGSFARTGSRNATEPIADPNPTSPRPTAPRPLPSDDRSMASRGSVGGELPINVPQPQIARSTSPAVSSRPPTRDPETYRSRRLEQRRAIALKNGGSEESERAVEASLRWMADVQEPAGFWSASRHGGGAAKVDPQGQNRLNGGLYADTGVTGLVVLSFLGAGYTHEEGKYTDVVSRAIKWLIDQQHANGYLGGNATRYDMMYCHAMATFALAEAYGMQNDPTANPKLRDAVANGVKLICAMQNDDGGWRYGKVGESDMSMFGWQLMALKSAVNAGVSVPEETRRGMTKFLKSRALGVNGGLAGYKSTDRPSPAMTAEALFCRQMFGARPNDAASQEAVSFLRQNLPRISAYDEYFWYYGTLAMFQMDGQPWEEWNGSLRDMLVGLQRTQGPLAGSWDPNGKWAGIGGRLYSTAVSTMSLEVYYRFLRIYQTDQ